MIEFLTCVSVLQEMNLTKMLEYHILLQKVEA